MDTFIAVAAVVVVAVAVAAEIAVIRGMFLQFINPESHNGFSVEHSIAITNSPDVAASLLISVLVSEQHDTNVVLSPVAAYSVKINSVAKASGVAALCYHATAAAAAAAVHAALHVRHNKYVDILASQLFGSDAEAPAVLFVWDLAAKSLCVCLCLCVFAEVVFRVT